MERKFRPFGTVYDGPIFCMLQLVVMLQGMVTESQQFGSSKRLICSAVNGNKNYCYGTLYQLGRYKFTTIIIQQVQNPHYGNYYFYQIIINNKTVVNVLNYYTRVFHNVKYFVSDPWYHTSKVNVISFKFEIFNHRGKNKQTLNCIINISNREAYNFKHISKFTLLSTICCIIK